MSNNTPTKENNVFTQYWYIEKVYEYFYFVWDEQDFDNWKADMWLWWALTGMVVGLIMSNLLITIVSDTYANVIANTLITDSHALNNVILELEVYLCFNRNKRSREHLVYAEYDTEMDYDNWTVDKNQMEGKVKDLLKSMEDRIVNKNKEVLDATASAIVESIKKA
jgi:hypothetical protein